jgi:hypothetical protein
MSATFNVSTGTASPITLAICSASTMRLDKRLDADCQRWSLALGWEVRLLRLAARRCADAGLSGSGRGADGGRDVEEGDDREGVAVNRPFEKERYLRVRASQGVCAKGSPGASASH